MPQLPPSSARHCPIRAHLVCQLAAGILVAEALALGLLVTDTGQLLTLVRASQQPLLDLALILAGAIMAIVPAVLATAVGLLGHADAPGNGLR